MPEIDIVSNDLCYGVYENGRLLVVTESPSEILEALLPNIKWHDRWDLERFPVDFSEVED